MTTASPKSTLLEYALSYAKQGFKVFPIYGLDVERNCKCKLRERCPHKGKHPKTPNGLKDATDDPELISAWWHEDPEANIGIRTGRESDILVVDVDQPTGQHSLEDLLKGATLPKEILEVTTGGGGRHLYFKHPRVPVPSKNGVLGEKLDVKCEGGYVLAPPSSHIEGNKYAWKNWNPLLGKPPTLLNIPKMLFDQIQEKLLKPKKQDVTVEGPLPVYKSGTRHDFLVSKAGKLRAAGLEPRLILEALREINKKQCDPPTEESELETIAFSMANYPPQPTVGISTQVQRFDIITQEQLDSIIYKGSRLKLSVNLPKEHFVSEYIDQSTKLSDAYPEYHHAAAVGLLSIAANRNLILKLTLGTIFPNVWGFCLGASTVSRKSTAVWRMREFAYQLFSFNSLPDSFSPESLVEILSKIPRAWLVRDEAASIMAAMTKTYMAEMRDLFCQLYDNKSFYRKLRSGQRKGQTEFKVEDPYITQVYATTPDNFSNNTTLVDVTSGWLLRFLYYFPSYPKAWMPPRISTTEEEAKDEELKEWLKELTKFFWGKPTPIIVKLSPEADKYLSEWLKRIEQQLITRNNELELAAYGRIMIYIYKLAMLYQIGEKKFLKRILNSENMENMSIEKEYIAEACQQAENYFLPTSVRVMETVEQFSIKNAQLKILKTLQHNSGKMKKTNLMRRLRMREKDLTADLEALRLSDEVREVYIPHDGGKGTTWVVLSEECEDDLFKLKG